MSLESLGKKETVDLVQYCLHANDETWDTIKAIRNHWDETWQAYNNQFGDAYTYKADWQSKNYIPKVKMAVRVTKATMKNALIKADQFFQLVGLNDSSKEIQKDIEIAISRLLDQARFKQQKFGRGLFLGLMENLVIFKVYPVPVKGLPIHKDQRYEIVIEPISAYDFRIDTSGREQFVIHRVKMDLSEFKRLVKEGVYKQEALKQIEEDFESAEEEYKEKIRKEEVDEIHRQNRKEVELLEYWGNVDDQAGNRVHTNVTFTVVNQKILARDPIPNPFKHGKPPFVWGPVIEKYGSVYHEGFLDGAIPIAKMMNESVNLILDANVSASVKAYEVALEYVHNPTELKSGIYPGKAIKTRGVPPGGRCIREFSLGEVPQSALQILATLDREFQNATGVNEFVSGSAGSPSSTTATEVKQKAGQSMALMQAIAGDLEDNVLEPTVEMVYSEMLQYNPEVFGDRVMMENSESLKFQFVAKGISKIMAQLDNMNNMFTWVNMMRQTPLASQVNWETIGKESARMLGQDASNLLLAKQGEPPEPGTQPTAPEDNQAQTAANMMQMIQGGAGGKK